MKLALDIFDDTTRNMWNLMRGSLEPLANITEMDNKIIVEIDLPMVRKSDIHLRLVEGGLEVEASLMKQMRYERWGTVQRTCEFRSLYKLISLPTPVVAEGAEAVFKKGILRVTLRKTKQREQRIMIE